MKKLLFIGLATISLLAADYSIKELDGGHLLWVSKDFKAKAKITTETQIITNWYQVIGLDCDMGLRTTNLNLKIVTDKATNIILLEVLGTESFLKRTNNYVNMITWATNAVYIPSSSRNW